MLLTLAFAQHRDAQGQYLLKTLRSIALSRHSINAVVYTCGTSETLKADIAGLGADIYECDAGAGYSLPYLCRPHLMQLAKDGMEYVGFSDNDILLTESTFDYLDEWFPLLRAEHPLMVPGLLRYEYKHGESSELHCPDAHPAHTGRGIFMGTKRLGNVRGWQMDNAHQGCFILHRSQVQAVVDAGFFHIEGSLEWGNSHPHWAAIPKLYPIVHGTPDARCLVHHQSNRYVNSHERGYWTWRNFVEACRSDTSFQSPFMKFNRQGPTGEVAA